MRGGRSRRARRRARASHGRSKKGLWICARGSYQLWVGAAAGGEQRAEEYTADQPPDRRPSLSAQGNSGTEPLDEPRQEITIQWKFSRKQARHRFGYAITRSAC